MQGVLPVLTPRLVGSRVSRVEDPRLLTGRGRYVADISLPGMLHASFLRSTLAHGRIASIDVAEAKALPGVHAVWTGADVKPLTPGLVVHPLVEGMPVITQPALAFEFVRYVGEPLAVVVADSRRIAEDATALIEVELDPLPAVLDIEVAVAGGGVANEDVPDNMVLDREFVNGDPDAAFASAAMTVSGRFRNGRSVAAPMETRGSVAHYDWATGQLTLWLPTQHPHSFRSMLSALLGMPEHLVQLIAPDVGGSFGQKAHMFPEELVVTLLSRELGAPVKWIEDRVENLITATHAKDQLNDMEIAFDEDGKILAMRLDSLGDGGAYNCCPWSCLLEPLSAVYAVTSVYDVTNIKTRCTAALTNKTPLGGYRGVGWTAPQIARESLLDQAARKLGLSPFELRKRNVVRAEQFPYTAATGLRFEEGSYLESTEALEKAIDYEAFRERQDRERERGRYLGLGISVFNEVTGGGTILARAIGYSSVTTHDTSTVRMEPSGAVTVFTTVTWQGQGLETTLGQIAADALGVAFEDVVVRPVDTRQGYGMGTYGSRSLVIGGGAILRAAEPIRQKLLQTASHILEAAKDDLVLANGRVEVKGAPSRGMTVGELAATIYFAGDVRPPGMDPTMESTASYDPSQEVYSNGAHAAIVEVDSETGFVTIERIVAVEDCGTMINPTVVEGQIRGGIAQSIGNVLLEEMVYDDEGQLLTTTFMDYLLPTASEVPPVEFIHIETPSKATPFGAKGLGESSMISAPAALVNAVNNAIEPFGAYLTDVPLTPDKILSAITA